MKIERGKFNFKSIISSFICLFFIFSVISFTGCTKQNKDTESKQLESNKEGTQGESNIENNVDKNTNTADDKVVEEKDNTSVQNSKVKFVKRQLQKSDEPKFATKWINSVNNKLSACIEGKGPDAEEEGIGKIYIKDLSSNEKWALEILPGEEQNTPKFIEWIDDENIISIVGLGYGTVSLGGNLYRINVNTGETVSLYETNTHKKQVISAKKNGDKLELEILVYDDDELIKTHTEKKVINIK